MALWHTGPDSFWLWAPHGQNEPLYLRRGLITPQLTDQGQRVAAHQLMGESRKTAHSAAVIQTLVSANGVKAEKMTPASPAQTPAMT